MTPARDLVKRADRVAVAYFGHAGDVPPLLNLLQPRLEEAMPGLRLYVSGRPDRRLWAVPGRPDRPARFVTQDGLVRLRGRFGCVFVLKGGPRSHPLDPLIDVLREFRTGSIVGPVEPPVSGVLNVSVSGGRPPTASQLRWADRELSAGRLDVCGSESAALVRAAAGGLRCGLLPSSGDGSAYSRILGCEIGPQRT